MSHRQPDVLDRERLKEIQENMIRMCSVNQKQVFAISEKTRGEYEKIAKDLERIKQRVAETMAKHDRLERQARFARSRVVELKEKVDDENEELQQAIEHANEIQIEISVERQAESQLRKKRDELERRLMHLKETLDQAEMLAGQVSVILKYLNGEIKNLADVLETAQQKQELGLKIIEAQEEERRRLSREIHDGPAQTLAHVLLSSEIVKKVFQEKGEEAAYHELENLKNPESVTVIL